MGRLTLLLLLRSLLHVVEAEWDPPQLCYVAPDQLAPNYIAPCWTSNKTPQYSCCKVGDMCLQHGACFNQPTGNTYQYGCTDAKYQDGICPSKCGLDVQKSNWVGLVYCNGTDDLPDKTWVCHHPDNCKDCINHVPWDPKIEKAPPTSCKDIKHDGQYVAFEEGPDDPRLMQISSDAFNWFSINADRWNTTSTVASPSSTITSTPFLTSLPPFSLATSTATNGSNATASQTSSPSSSSKVPMAVGIGVGIPAVIAIVGIAAFYILRRRKRQQPENSSFGSPGGHDTKDPMVAQTDDGPYGIVHKAELSAEERPISEVPGSPSQLNEMEGSTVGERSPGQSPFVSPLLSQYGHAGANEHRVSGIDPVHELPAEDFDGTRVLHIPDSPPDTIEIANSNGGRPATG